MHQNEKVQLMFFGCGVFDLYERTCAAAANELEFGDVRFSLKQVAGVWVRLSVQESHLVLPEIRRNIIQFISPFCPKTMLFDQEQHQKYFLSWLPTHLNTSVRSRNTCK